MIYNAEKHRGRREYNTINGYIHDIHNSTGIIQRSSKQINYFKYYR